MFDSDIICIFNIEIYRKVLKSLAHSEKKGERNWINVERAVHEISQYDAFLFSQQPLAAFPPPVTMPNTSVLTLSVVFKPMPTSVLFLQYTYTIVI